MALTNDTDTGKRTCTMSPAARVAGTSRPTCRIERGVNVACSVVTVGAMAPVEVNNTRTRRRVAVTGMLLSAMRPLNAGRSERPGAVGAMRRVGTAGSVTSHTSNITWPAADAV